jgi:membrane fusion protein, multidrug efflux system
MNTRMSAMSLAAKRFDMAAAGMNRSMSKWNRQSRFSIDEVSNMRIQRLKAILLPLVPILTLGALAVAGIGCGKKADPAAAPGAPASQVLVSPKDVVGVELRRLESGVSFTGELVPSETVEITARFAGDLEDVMVREGQHVRKGEPLARFRPRDVQDMLNAADSQLMAAHAGLTASLNAERRARRLLDAGAASPSDLEAAEAQRTAAEAQVHAAEAVKNRAQEDAERLDVPSPIDGWVSAVVVHEGDRVAIGDRLLTVVDTQTLELSATVPSEALSRVQPGTPIRFRLAAYPGEQFTGKVDRVNPTTEPGTRQVRIYMRLPNPDGRLVGGIFAKGRVIDSVKEQTISAPLAALRKEGQEQVVYRLRNGKAERIAVRTGIVDEDADVVELLGDLSAGDSLLSGVVPGLKDGVSIRILSGQDQPR